MSSNLPAVTVRTGGAVVAVLSWDQHSGLSDEARTSITQVVRKHPELNTEGAVDLLADTAGYHAVDLDPWVARMIGEFDIDQFYRAIEVLREAAIRSPRDAGQPVAFAESEATRGHVEAMLTLIATMEEHTGELPSNTQVIDLIDRFNAWEDCRKADRDEITTMLDDPGYEPDYGAPPKDDPDNG